MTSVKRVKGDGRIFRPIRNGRELPYWHLAYWGPLANGGMGEIRETSHTDDENKARKLLRDRVRSVANHRGGRERFIGPRAERITVHELLESMFRDYETRGMKSLPTYRSHVSHLKEFFGGAKAIAVTTDDVRRYIALRREQGAAKATVDRETGQLGRAYNLAIAEGRLSFKPRIPTILKPNENAEQGFFERAELEAIVSHIQDADVRDYLWWFYFTGMRPGEITSLTWEGFDRETWTLRLAAKDAKTGRGRGLALTGEWRTIIERRIAARRLDCPLIFHRGGRRIIDFNWLWRSACEKAGFPGRRMYGLRRSAVRNLIRAGVSQTVAMKISGHETEAMFRRYNITSSADVAAAGERLTEYVATLPSSTTTTALEFETRKKVASDSETVA